MKKVSAFALALVLTSFIYACGGCKSSNSGCNLDGSWLYDGAAVQMIYGFNEEHSAYALVSQQQGMVYSSRGTYQVFGDSIVFTVYAQYTGSGDNETLVSDTKREVTASFAYSDNTITVDGLEFSRYSG